MTPAHTISISYFAVLLPTLVAHQRGLLSLKEAWGVIAALNTLCCACDLTIVRVSLGQSIWDGLCTLVTILMWLLCRDDDEPRKRRRRLLGKAKVRLRQFAVARIRPIQRLRPVGSTA
jgi:hypothetical protein